ncbi:MAG: nucleotidyltransferase [Bacteroidetes bacterium SW_9_63_38]|nr:MAG: nucleotidyltransferase [Bacteroidetes bacterium SW_9_63_38]
MPSLLSHHREEILRLAHRHGAHNVRVFGSAARGDNTEDSDVDVLVELEEGRSLVDRVALKQDLENLLGKTVDVVTEASLHPRMRKQVLREAVPLR